MVNTQKKHNEFKITSYRRRGSVYILEPPDAKKV